MKLPWSEKTFRCRISAWFGLQNYGFLDTADPEPRDSRAIFVHG